jgi:transposase
MERHELTDQQWDVLASFFPAQRKRGGQWRDHRTVVNGALWRLRTGVPWRDLPERYGPWQTVHRRFTAWQKTGLLDRILGALQVRLDERGGIDWDLWCIDGSSVRGSRAAAGASKKK